MKISYIPPVQTANELPMLLPQDIISNAIERAIEHAVIDPFKTWLWRTSVKAIIVAEWGCIIGCTIGIIMIITGLKQGSKVSKVCFLTHLGIQIIKVVLL